MIMRLVCRIIVACGLLLGVLSWMQAVDFSSDTIVYAAAPIGIVLGIANVLAHND